MVVFSVLVGDLVWDFTGDLVRDFVGDLVGDFVKDLVRDFPRSVSVGEGGGIFVGNTDRNLGGEEIREIDGDLNGEGGVAGSSSMTVVRLTLGESSMTLGSSKFVMAGFGMSKWTDFGFFLDETVSAIDSLNASEISYRACLMAISPSGSEAGSSDLFLFVSHICVSCAFDHILNARWRTFF